MNAILTILLVIIVFLSPIVFIVGLVNPRLILRESKHPTRLKIFGWWILFVFLSLFHWGLLNQLAESMKTPAEIISSSEKDIANGRYEDAIKRLKHIRPEDPLYASTQQLIFNTAEKNYDEVTDNDQTSNYGHAKELFDEADRSLALIEAKEGASEILKAVKDRSKAKFTAGKLFIDSAQICSPVCIIYNGRNRPRFLPPSDDGIISNYQAAKSLIYFEEGLNGDNKDTRFSAYLMTSDGSYGAKLFEGKSFQNVNAAFEYLKSICKLSPDADDMESKLEAVYEWEKKYSGLNPEEIFRKADKQYAPLLTISYGGKPLSSLGYISGPFYELTDQNDHLLKPGAKEFTTNQWHLKDKSPDSYINFYKFDRWKSIVRANSVPVLGFFKCSVRGDNRTYTRTDAVYETMDVHTYYVDILFVRADTGEAIGRLRLNQDIPPTLTSGEVEYDSPGKLYFSSSEIWNMLFPYMKEHKQ